MALWAFNRGLLIEASLVRFVSRFKVWRGWIARLFRRDQLVKLQLVEVRLVFERPRLLDGGLGEVALQVRVIRHEVAHALLGLVPAHEAHREALARLWVRDVPPVAVEDDLGGA